MISSSAGDRSVRLGAVLALAGMVACGPAAGQAPGAGATVNVCVVCSEPAATYTCEVSGLATGTGVQPVQHLCSQRLAQEGGHAQCAARRVGSACEGSARVYALEVARERPGGAAVEPSEVPATHAAGAAHQGEQAKSSAVARMASKVVEKSSDGLRQTGEVVEGAAKSTWRCIASFLSDCKPAR